MQNTMNPYNKIDCSDMYNILLDFPRQVREALEIGRNFKLPDLGHFDSVVILGMGGSAIGGDLLRTYSGVTEGASSVQIMVNRGYDIPGWADEHTLFIASSYSGGTEETLNAFSQAAKVSNKLLAITTGGKLQKFCLENQIAFINIPSGMQPRCAIGYSFIPLLSVMLRSGAWSAEAVGQTEAALSELSEWLSAQAQSYSQADEGIAAQIASILDGKAPVIYSSYNVLDTVSLRWRGQFQENAKNLAFGNVLPEMNHNEVNSWNYPQDMLKYLQPVFLNDPLDHPRIVMRFHAIGKLLEGKGIKPVVVRSGAKHLLTRMFDLIYLGDWISYFMAVRADTDPTPIPDILMIKDYLADK